MNPDADYWTRLMALEASEKYQQAEKDRRYGMTDNKRKKTTAEAWQDFYDAWAGLWRASPVAFVLVLVAVVSVASVIAGLIA